MPAGLGNWCRLVRLRPHICRGEDYPGAAELAKANLFWAFAYNLAALPLTALGLVNPLIAGAAMALSSGEICDGPASTSTPPRPRPGRTRVLLRRIHNISTGADVF
jgi:hypothetical protein